MRRRRECDQVFLAATIGHGTEIPLCPLILPAKRSTELDGFEDFRHTAPWLLSPGDFGKVYRTL